MTDLGLSRDPRLGWREFSAAEPELLAGPGLSGRPVGTCVPPVTSGPDAEQLHELLQDATGTGVVTSDDCRLLLRLAEHASTRHSGRGRGGLFARSTATYVAAEWGVSRATVTRRADRALGALHHAYAKKVRCA